MLSEGAWFSRAKETAASNYTPIVCFPLMWKLLGGIFEERIYGYLQGNRFFQMNGGRIGKGREIVLGEEGIKREIFLGTPCFHCCLFS